MSLFNISGSAEWEVSEVGERLCQNFDKGNARKKKNKIRKKDKRKHVDDQKNALLNESNGIDNSLIGKPKLLKKIKKKFLKETYSTQLDDGTSSSNSINRSDISDKDIPRKKGLKRKHSLTSGENEWLLKKRKNDVDHSKNNALTNEPNTEKKQVKKHKKKKNENGELLNPTKQRRPQDSSEINAPVPEIDPPNLKIRKQQLKKLQKLIQDKDKKNLLPSKKESASLTLRQKMMMKLKAARFRFLNEQIYNTTSRETEKIFRKDPEAFKAYHEGYKLQVRRWPLNPLDKIIKSLRKMAKTLEIADFGCGEAKLAKSVEQKVHSFDLVAVNDLVTACDMAHVPLPDSSVDVVVFCLSLMGINLKDYFREANRVLKKGGLVKIAEVESRFDDVDAFIKECEQFGFKKAWMDLSYNLFYFIDFKKESNVRDKKKLPSITLQPCLYKKR